MWKFHHKKKLKKDAPDSVLLDVLASRKTISFIFMWVVRTLNLGILG